MTDRVTFGIVGGAGFRAQYYFRIARALPDRFAVASALVRDPGKAAAVTQEWGVPTGPDLDELLAAEPAFVVLSADPAANRDYLTRLARHGMPVLLETPPARDVAELVRVWETGARVQVAEQYQYHPLNQARLALIEDGSLGRVTQATVSVSHRYHGISLLRRFLGTGFGEVRIRAMAFESDVVNGPGRAGPPTREEIVPSTRELAWLDFGDRLGVYDFTWNQHRSWIRSNHVSVRGVRGEIFDQRVSVLHDFATPLPMELRRVNRGETENPEGYFLRGIVAGERWAYVNPFAPARLYDDELAIATCLAKMAEYVAGGPEFYGLADACQDAYLGVLVEQAIRSGEAVTSVRQPWARDR
jgi:Oxidoreductase family, NAD-binding Rossmann fold